MFLGSTPPVIASFIANQITDLQPPRIIIPFSGNFVFEQLAFQKSPASQVISTDVSIYSRAIGHALAGNDIEIKIKEELKSEFPHLAEKTDPIEKAATVIFFSQISEAYAKKDEIKYYNSMYRNVKNTQETQFREIVEKLLQLKKKTAFTFLGTCATKLLENVEKSDLVLFDPPYWADGYEKMFKNLPQCLDYQDVDYTLITDEIKIELLHRLNEKGANVLYRTIYPIESEIYRPIFWYQYKNDLAYEIYANYPTQDFVGRANLINEQIKNLPLISETDTITPASKINVIQTPLPVINHYRLMWTKKATLTMGGTGFLVFIDQKLIGILQLVSGQRLSTGLVSIFSDTTVPYSKYKRLSKLLLYICCTKEMLKIMSDREMWQHNGFTTKAVTNNPVSMKYRGLFKLKHRKKEKHGNYKYSLIYQNRENIFDNYQTALTQWVNKYAAATK